jgi:hypothetical protein
MTGNQIKGKGFRGALRYNLDKVERQVAEVLDHSFASVSEKSIMKEIQFVRMLRPNLQKYFYHTSVNFPPSEDLSNQMMTQIGRDYLKANGFTQHQFIMFRHKDAVHPHLHILVNRIGYDGKVLSDSNDYKRSETILRNLEVKYKLTRVTPSKEVKERAMTKDELEMMKRTSGLSQKLKLQLIIKDLLRERRDMTTQVFIQALESKGVNVLFNQARTGFVSGISYGYAGFTIKGAKLGNDFKWASIKKMINYRQERDRIIIHEANSRTKVVGLQYNAKNSNDQGVRPPSPTSRLEAAENATKNFDLELLLNSFSARNSLHAENQSDSGSENLFSQRRKRKKRRGKRT